MRGLGYLVGALFGAGAGWAIGNASRGKGAPPAPVPPTPPGGGGGGGGGGNYPGPGTVQEVIELPNPPPVAACPIDFGPLPNARAWTEPVPTIVGVWANVQLLRWPMGTVIFDTLTDGTRVVGRVECHYDDVKGWHKGVTVYHPQP